MHMVRNPPIIGLQLVLLIFGWMTPTGKEPLHHKLGRIGLRITPLALVIAVFWYLIPDGKPAPPQSASVLMGANAPTPAATLVSLPSLRKPLNDEAALRVMLMQKLGTTKEGLDMQWDLIRIAKRESNFKQNGPDGKVIHGEDPPKGNPADTCMFMINTVKQADVVAKHDISTLDGCVDAAIEIYRKDLKDPMHPWFLSDNNDAVHTGEKVYIGPVGHWSEKIPTGYGATILPPDGWIEVTTDKGEKYELGKPGVTGYIKPVPSLWIKIQSKTEDEVNVTVIP